MFSPQIVESDAFLDMPPSSQALYFHLGMRADDDGFVNPKMVMRLIGSAEDDLKVLLAKRFLLKFETGVVVIKHWLIHNLIRNDLYKETLYIEEKNQIGLKDNGAYTELREGVSSLKRIEAPEWLLRRRGDRRTASVPPAVLRLGKVRVDSPKPTVLESSPDSEEESTDLSYGDELDSDGEEKASRWPSRKSKGATSGQNAVYRRVCKKFVDMCHKELEIVPVVAFGAAASLLKRAFASGFTETMVYDVFEDWFSNSSKPVEDLAQITQALSAVNLTKFKATSN
jgi:hypothetical protein